MTISAPASCRPLERRDLEDVVHLMTTSFLPERSPYMVGTQHGWGRFVEVALEHPTQFPHQRLVVAEVDGRVAGFADFRVPGDGTGHLSYICVAPTARRRGVARALLAACVGEAGPLRSVSLDVFEDNAPARALYQALGFVQVDAATWWRSPLQAGVADPSLQLEGLPASMAAHARYGFCELKGSRAGQQVRYGRMGESVLRFFTQDDFDDPRVGEALVAEFPGLAESFVVLPADRRPSRPGAEAINTSMRMTTDDVQALVPGSGA